MQAPRDHAWTTASAVLGGALVVLVPTIVVLNRVLPPGSYVLLVPLLLCMVPLVLALGGRLEPGPDRPPARDLERLVTRKRAGGSPIASRPTRRAGGRLPAPGAGRASPPDPPAGPLDRLVRRKREWTEPGAAPGQDEEHR